MDVCPVKGDLTIDISDGGDCGGDDDGDDGDDDDGDCGGLISFLFHLQVPELGDTVFIVLRKQPLIFLHWSDAFVIVTLNHHHFDADNHHHHHKRHCHHHHHHFHHHDDHNDDHNDDNNDDQVSPCDSAHLLLV